MTIERSLDGVVVAAAVTALPTGHRSPPLAMFPSETQKNHGRSPWPCGAVSTLLQRYAERRRLRFRERDVALGLLSAVGLYAIFQAGDRMARSVMPKGSQEIGDIYALRSLRPKSEIATRLATVIGPAEELFWRGFVQRRVGAAGAVLAYGGAHLVTGNATLIGAATVAGVFWGALPAVGMSMPALITSHVAWDSWIFLLAPTEREQDPESG